MTSFPKTFSFDHSLSVSANPNRLKDEFCHRRYLKRSFVAGEGQESGRGESGIEAGEGQEEPETGEGAEPPPRFGLKGVYKLFLA